MIKPPGGGVVIYTVPMSEALMTTIGLDTKANAWRSINDAVMGGLSSGGMMQLDAGLRFTGELSLENNGGFSSAWITVLMVSHGEPRNWPCQHPGKWGPSRLYHQFRGGFT